MESRLRESPAIARHGVRLSRARLAVREETDVVSVAHASNQRGTLFVDVALRGVGPKDAIERVRPERIRVFARTPRRRANHQTIGRPVVVVDDAHDVAVRDAVRFGHARSNAAKDADRTFEVLDGVVQSFVFGARALVQRRARRERLHSLGEEKILLLGATRRAKRVGANRRDLATKRVGGDDGGLAAFASDATRVANGFRERRDVAFEPRRRRRGRLRFDASGRE